MGCRLCWLAQGRVLKQAQEQEWALAGWWQAVALEQACQLLTVCLLKKALGAIAPACCGVGTAAVHVMQAA